MVRYLFILICFLIMLFAAQRLIPEHNYSIYGSGDGAIMLDTKTGEAWVLETDKLSTSLQIPHILNCDEDFCGPKRTRYYWVPTAVCPCYSSMSFGRDPEEVRKTDEKTLSVWGNKLSIN